MMNQRSLLDSMISSALCGNVPCFKYKPSDALFLCKTVKPILMKEETVLDLSGPINIVGDLHGQLDDLVKCIQIGGLPPFTKWLFLGDYVDRGPNSVEVMCLLFALKIRYPGQVFLIRGNHETTEMTSMFGFQQECTKKLNASMWSIFCDTFEYMPIAAIVEDKFFCIHGGISPQLDSVQQIRDMTRPLHIPQRGLLTDLLWSDPTDETFDFGISMRGNTCTYGVNAAKRFLQANNLKMIVRGHQVAENGYDFPFLPDKSCVTIFTAGNYSADRNKAAFMVIDQLGKYEIKMISSPPTSPTSHFPPTPRVRKTMNIRKYSAIPNTNYTTNPTTTLRSLTPRPRSQALNRPVESGRIPSYRHSYSGKNYD